LSADLYRELYGTARYTWATWDSPKLTFDLEDIIASLRKLGSTFYVSYYAGGKEHRLSLDTDNLQLAKEKLRQFESAQLRAHDRTCVFIEHWDLAQSPTIHQANQYEIDDLWDKHRLVALLPVIKNLQSQAGQFTDRHFA
jgi:hypothetical protein